MENINKKFLSDPSVTHVISFDNETVSCYGHTDQSVVALVRRYYEGDFKKDCSVYVRSGNVIYKTKPEAGKFNAFFNAYITAALWSSVDDNGDPLDANYTAESIAPVTLEKMKADCEKFCENNLIVLTALDDKSLQSFELSGHDFWLTRSGHGAGFWDRGLGAVGEVLTVAAGLFGDSPLYVGDDNLIYQ